MLAEASAGLDLAQLSTLGPVGILCLAVVVLARILDTMVTRAFAQVDARKAEKSGEVTDPLISELKRLLPGGGTDTEGRLRELEREIAELRGERRARTTGSHQRAENE